MKMDNINVFILLLWCTSVGESSKTRTFATVAVPLSWSLHGQHICHFIISTNSTTAFVNITQKANTTAIEIGPGQSYTLTLNEVNFPSLGLDDKVYYITSYEEIHVVMHYDDTLHDIFEDAYQVPDKSAAGLHYYGISHPSLYTCTPSGATNTLQVIAYEDDTEVTISPPAGNGSSITMDRFGVYTMFNSEGSDDVISESRVTANKNISVVSGNLCFRYTHNSPISYGSAFTRMTPVGAYSNRFILPVIGGVGQRGYTIKVVASMNNTLVTVGDGEYTVNEGMTLTVELLDVATITEVNCSSPCDVIQIAIGNTGLTGTFMMNTIPLESFYHSCFFSTSDYDYTHYVTLVVKGVGPVDDIYLDTKSLESQEWRNDGEFSYMSMNIIKGLHTLMSMSRPLAAYVYSHTGNELGGYGYAVTTSAVSGDVNIDDVNLPSVVIDLIKPLQGIQAGGTRISLIGKNFPPRVTLYIGDRGIANDIPCESSVCFAKTPAVNTSVVNSPLPIDVHFEGTEKIETDFRFTYKGNPSITNIHPLETLIDGGTTITVTGQSLDAVGDPTLQVITVHTILNTATKMTTTFESSCRATSATDMKCVSPNMTVPAQFKATDAKEDSMGKQGSGDLILEIENERLDLYLGFNLDGDSTYGNVSEALPDLGQFSVFVLTPECEPFDDVVLLEAESVLQVKGKRLDHGLTASDYTVKIRDKEVCQVVQFASNEIVCELPTLPLKIKHGITVYPGVNLDGQFIGHIKVHSPEDNTLYYIIGGSIAGGFLIIIPTVLVISIVARRHKSQMKERRAREAFDTDIVDRVRQDPREALRHGIPVHVQI